MPSDLVISFLTLRKLIGLFGLILPIMLLVGPCLVSSMHFQPSISDYYYTEMRDYFVGNMFVIGVFLTAYRGHDSDHVLMVIAGLSAICVALFPCGEGGITAVSIVHFISAGSFFGMVGYISAFVFTKSGQLGSLTKKKNVRNVWFRVCGFTIFALLAILGACILLIRKYNFPLNDYLVIFILESLAVWCFSLSWLIKGQAILQDEKLT